LVTRKTAQFPQPNLTWNVAGQGEERMKTRGRII
jgi:hypothetical protein